MCEVTWVQMGSGGRALQSGSEPRWVGGVWLQPKGRCLRKSEALSQHLAGKGTPGRDIRQTVTTD